MAASQNSTTSKTELSQKGTVIKQYNCGVCPSWDGKVILMLLSRFKFLFRITGLWIEGQTNKLTNGWTDGLSDGWIDRWTEILMSWQTHKWLTDYDGLMDWRSDSQMDWQTDELTDLRTDWRLTDGLIDWWTNGRMDGRTDWLMDWRT